MNPDGARTLLAEAAIVILAAPILGVAIRPSRRLAAAIVVLVIVGAGAIVSRGPTLEAVALSQATLLAAACALAALGRLCRTAFRDSLDAAACSLVIALALTMGPLVAGPSAGNLPTPLLNAMLTVNPVAATASAAGIDLFRSEPLYRLSPIAHVRFAYAPWPMPVAVFGLVAIIATLRHPSEELS